MPYTAALEIAAKKHQVDAKVNVYPKLAVM
jgi:hypothetical protein